MDKSRVQAYLQSACSVLNFDIGEIWCCRQNYTPEVVAGALSRSKDLRFIQLYTSPAYEKYRTKLVIPKEIPDEHDTEKHHFSPLICEAVREAGQVVWLHTPTNEGLLGRSDLPLRTAMGAPICSIGFDLCILVMFSPVMLELTEEAHRFLYTVAQAASEGVCGFMPASNTSPLTNPALSGRPKRLEPSSGHHTRMLIDALGPSVVLRMVNMTAVPLQAPVIKREFMDCFNAIYSPAPPPSQLGGQASLPPLALDDDEGEQLMTLPPLEEFELPPELLEDDEWDLDVALEYVFEGEKPANTAAGPVSGAGWFPVAAGGGEGKKGGAEQGEEESPIKFFYEDALQRLRFEEFVKGFLSMSVFHTAECWVVRGTEGLEQVYCATCLADIQSWVQFSQKLHAGPQRSLPARIARENQSVWERDFDRFNATLGGASGQRAHKGHVIKTAYGLPVPIDKSHRLIVVFYSQLAMEPAQLMESFVKRAMDFLWHKGDDAPPLTAADSSSDLPDEATFAPQASAPLPSIMPEAPVMAPSRIGATYAESAAQGIAQAQASSAQVYGGGVTTRLPPPAQAQHAVPQYYHPVQVQGQGVAMYGVGVGGMAPPPPQQEQQQMRMAPPSSAAYAVPSYATANGYYAQQGWQHYVEIKPPMPMDMPGGAPEMLPSVMGMQQSQQAGVGQGTPHMMPYAQQQQQQQMGMPMHMPQVQQPQAPLAYQYSPSGVGGAIPHYAPLPPQHMHVQQPQAQAYAYAQAPHMQQQQQQQMRQMALPPRAPPPVSVSISQPVTQAAAHAHSSAPMYIPTSASIQPPSLAYDPSVYGSSPPPMMQRPTPPMPQQTYAMPAMSPPPVDYDTRSVDGTGARKAAGARHCQYPGCTKCAQGNTKFCIAHGGGRRCTYPGCTKGARDKNFCAAHGGGKRCTVDGCTKSAVGGSLMCTAHGGGRRCQYQDCTRSAQSSTNFCVRHGGGRKCQVDGCQKVARGRTSYCAAHGGGVRCKVEGCNKAAVGKFQLCRVHSGYPNKRASEPISTTHFVENPAKKRLVVHEGGEGPPRPPVTMSAMLLGGMPPPGPGMQGMGGGGMHTESV